MLKKAISLLIAVCVLICLSACSTVETVVNVKDTPDKQSEFSTDNTPSTDDATIVENDSGSQALSTSKYSKTTASQTNTTVNYYQPTKKQPEKTTEQTTHIHSYSNATCTLPKKCYCGATAGTALGHKFSTADCTSPRICSRCGTTSGNALGHSFSNANCNSPKTCTRCGQTEGSELGHNYVNNKCSLCGKVDPDSLPVRLNDLHLIDSSFGNTWHKYEYKSSAFTDSFGNVYDGAHCYIGVLNEGQYSTHNLNGKYLNFTGSIVAMQNTSTAGTYSISIYVDGVLKYSKSQFSKTTGKTDFSINVKGGSALTIKVCMDSGSGDSNMNVAIVNAQLTK